MKKNGEAATWERMVSALQKLPNQEDLVCKLEKRFSILADPATMSDNTDFFSNGSSTQRT